MSNEFFPSPSYNMKVERAIFDKRQKEHITERRLTIMNESFQNITHAAQRKAVEKLIDSALSKVKKDREDSFLKMVNLAEIFLDASVSKEQFDSIRNMIKDPDNRWMNYIDRAIRETDPHVAKMTALNLGFEAAFRGTKMIRKNREKYGCNIPWLILFDPTSACNMHCTGCWSGTYGHKHSLSFEDMDKIVTQGKELGVYLYMLADKGARFGFYFHYMPVGNKAVPELMPTSEQRKYIIERLRYIRSDQCNIPFFPMDFQNDGEPVGGCIAGGRNYFHINSAGDAEPCVFIHYSNANIHDSSILEILRSPLFMEYRKGQPFNQNHLRPCPMLENPKILQEMVHRAGAHSTDLESPETVEHLCGKCIDYAKEWAEEADKIWGQKEHKTPKYQNYASR